MSRHTWFRAIASAAAVALLGVAPAFPHHSFAAEFDAKKPVLLTGKLTRLEWTNPHAYLYLDVSEAGAVANWAVEMGSPNGLTRLGWTRTLVKIGDELTVEGTLARFKPHLANARSVTVVATGKKLGAASSESAK